MGLGTGFISLWHLTTIASRQGQGFILRAIPHAFPLTNPRYTLLSCTILLAYLTLNLSSSSSPSRYQSASSSAYPMNEFQHNLLHTPSKQSCPSPSFPHGQTIGEHLHQSFRLHLRHPAQLPYPYIRDFINSHDTQQTSADVSEVVHLYSPNLRLLIIPAFHCLTTIRKNRHQK